MGDYVNPGVRKFQMSLNSEIYVDKSNLIAKTNALLDTERRFICISRPRRFGKTMAANMLAAYYGLGNDASTVFANLAITQHPTYEEHRNKYHVIMINVQEFLSKAKQESASRDIAVTAMLDQLRSTIIAELIEAYPEINYRNKGQFIQVQKDIYRWTKRPFVILIDEWDCIFREYKGDDDAQEHYLDFLRLWLKDQGYVGLAYMTGILPIKKYGTHSALNMFREYSMTNPRQFLDYFGFKGSEVEELAARYGVDFDEVKKWYNGYFIELGMPIYNPTSVSECLESHVFDSYWNKTETYEALKDYITFDFDGLQNKYAQLIAGDDLYVNPDKFANDMHTFNSIDDVLTLLVHLGYLSYCGKNSTVRIPNAEVKREFINSIEDLADWGTIVNAIRSSKALLQAIWNKEAAVVAEAVGKVHEENTSILQYNDENSLSCVLSLALYTASNYYSIIRELPSGKGYADLVFIPRKKFVDKPAMIVELKWDRTAKGAISQIKDKHYISALADYHGNLLLVGINYNKETKDYTCLIEALDI